jgi:hypothetical protein
MHKRLSITEAESFNKGRIILTLIAGLTTLLRENAISIEEAEACLFSPYSAECLKELDFDDSIIDLIWRGCELENFKSLMPDALDTVINDMINKSILEVKMSKKGQGVEVNKWIAYPENIDKYLPIGTVVLVKQRDTEIMICGRQQSDVATGKVYDYVGCFYPEGNINNERTFLFNHDHIVKIVHMGYSNKENMLYLDKLRLGSHYDIYGFLLMDVDTIKTSLESILDCEFEAYYNPYIGEYYGCGEAGSEILLKPNSPIDRELLGEDSSDYLVLLYVDYLDIPGELHSLLSGENANLLKNREI